MIKLKSPPHQPVKSQSSPAINRPVSKQAKKPPPRKKEPPQSQPKLKQSLLKVLLILNLILLILFLVPFYLINSTSKEIEQTRASSLASRINLTTTAKVKADLITSQEEASLIFNALPNEENIIEFIKLIDSLNASVKVKSFVIQANEPVAQAGFFYLPISLYLTGSLDEIFTALNSLAKSPYFLEFTSVKFTASASESLFNQATLETNFKLYVSHELSQP